MLIGVRFPDDLIPNIDAFRRAQADLPSRPEAIRRLTLAALPNNNKRRDIANGGQNTEVAA
jgi:hypothetical protein